MCTRSTTLTKAGVTAGVLCDSCVLCKFFNMLLLQILQADVYGGVLVDVIAVYGGEQDVVVVVKGAF